MVARSPFDVVPDLHRRPEIALSHLDGVAVANDSTSRAIAGGIASTIFAMASSSSAFEYRLIRTTPRHVIGLTAVGHLFVIPVKTGSAIGDDFGLMHGDGLHIALPGCARRAPGGIAAGLVAGGRISDVEGYHPLRLGVVPVLLVVNSLVTAELGDVLPPRDLVARRCRRP
jgi:hypothetical protein